MKVLMINGSPRLDGNTSILLNEMKNIFINNKIEVEEIIIGNKDVRGCIGCGYCSSHDGCCLLCLT